MYTSALKLIFNSKLLFYFLLLASYFLLLAQQAEAKALVEASDTLSTARPSAKATISDAMSANSTQVVITDNNSIILASESAMLRTTADTTIGSTTIASVSAQNTPTTGKRTVYFQTAITNPATAGDLLVMPVKAMHTFEFTTQTTIPSGGNIVITFPGSANNNAYPSVGSFAFNGLTGTDIKFNNATCGTITVSSPNITCDAVTSTITAGTTITILVGCTTASGAACTTKNPILINPLVTTSGGDDNKITIRTQDTTDSELDVSFVTVTTGTSVLVSGTVESRFTFTLGGVSDSTAANDTNPGCSLVETTNAGVNARATSLTLGQLQYTPSQKDKKISNITAQLLGVSTNSLNGYVLLASSNAPLTHDRGISIFKTSALADVPESFPSAANYFGMHACGVDTPSVTWTEAGNQNCSTVITGSTANECKYAWPKIGDDIILAADYQGPIGSGQAAGNGLTSVVYAAGIDGTIAAGEYTTTVTYTSLPTF